MCGIGYKSLKYVIKKYFPPKSTVSFEYARKLRELQFVRTNNAPKFELQNLKTPINVNEISNNCGFCTLGGLTNKTAPEILNFTNLAEGPMTVPNFKVIFKNITGFDLNFMEFEVNPWNNMIDWIAQQVPNDLDIASFAFGYCGKENEIGHFVRLKAENFHTNLKIKIIDYQGTYFQYSQPTLLEYAVIAKCGETTFGKLPLNLKPASTFAVVPTSIYNYATKDSKPVSRYESIRYE